MPNRLITYYTFTERIWDGFETPLAYRLFTYRGWFNPFYNQILKITRFEHNGITLRVQPNANRPNALCLSPYPLVYYRFYTYLYGKADIQDLLADFECITLYRSRALGDLPSETYDKYTLYVAKVRGFRVCFQDRCLWRFWVQPPAPKQYVDSTSVARWALLVHKIQLSPTNPPPRIEVTSQEIQQVRAIGISRHFDLIPNPQIQPQDLASPAIKVWDPKYTQLSPFRVCGRFYSQVTGYRYKNEARQAPLWIWLECRE